MQNWSFGIVFFFASLFFFQVNAQTDSLFQKSAFASRYQNETIYMTLTGYMKNEKLYDMGITGGKLKKEMLASPESVVVFEKFQRQRGWTYLFSVIQLATEITALTTKDKHLRTGMLIGAGAMTGIILPLYLGSSKNLSKAVWIRNGAVLKGR